jgi:hypothetical protein
MRPDTRRRWVLPLAVSALVLWPLSFAWVPAAGHNPFGVLVLVPVAEIGAIVLAMAAIWLGSLAARDEQTTSSSKRGVRLAMLGRHLGRRRQPPRPGRLAMTDE